MESVRGIVFVFSDLEKEIMNPYISLEACYEQLLEDMYYQQEKLEMEYRYRRMANLDITEIEVYLDNMNWLRIKTSLYAARLRNLRRERKESWN